MGTDVKEVSFRIRWNNFSFKKYPYSKKVLFTIKDQFKETTITMPLDDLSKLEDFVGEVWLKWWVEDFKEKYLRNKNPKQRRRR
ncbi:MAG: hypothetical protein ACOC80_16345 [Petrotogales bacterium]